jgi:hypothetical protein
MADFKKIEDELLAAIGAAKDDATNWRRVMPKSFCCDSILAAP